MKEQVHDGAVNVIRVTDTFNQSVCIITGGEDGFVKIWSPRMDLLQTLNPREINPTPDLSNPKAYGIQSLDIYLCDKRKFATLLIGIRSGDVLEGEVAEEWQADP